MPASVPPRPHIIVGDALAVLKTLDAESVQCVVTSPPYWALRDYGVDGQLGLEPTPDAYIAAMTEVFREVRRVLRNDGVCFVNMGDSYAAERSYQVPDSKHTDVGNSMAMCIPSGLKPKDLVGMPWRLAFALQADGWWLRSDIIWHKCLSGGARVYAKTQKGEMPMTVKDLVRLDPQTVQLWDGQKWNQAVSWTRQSRVGDELEVVLRSGERIGCTPSHKWPTNRGILTTADLCKGDVIDSCILPEPVDARCPSNLPDDLIGWFIGLYIAEGSQSDGTIQIASHTKETERFEKLQTLVQMYDGCMAIHNTGGNACTININAPVILGIVNTYVSGRIARDKHLSPRCWKRGNAFLRAVLFGYLEGDGHWTGERWRLGFCNNANLADDLRTICARIGYSLRLKRTQHACNGKLFPGFRGELRETHKNDSGQVMSIAKSRARVFWDISLADDPHTFALASGICTKNSNPMPESVTDRPTKSHEYVFLLTKAARYYYDAEAIKEDAAWERWGKQTVDKQYRGIKPVGMDSLDDRREAGRNARTVWTIPTQSFSEAHFATYPEALAARCILAGTSERGACANCGAPWERVLEIKDTDGRLGKGYHNHDNDLGRGQRGVPPAKGAPVRQTTGFRPTCTCGTEATRPCVVLDPFCGSGTTGLVALRYGRSFVGIELNPEYAAMAERRIAPEFAQPQLLEVAI